MSFYAVLGLSEPMTDKSIICCEGSFYDNADFCQRILTLSMFGKRVMKEEDWLSFSLYLRHSAFPTQYARSEKSFHYGRLYSSYGLQNLSRRIRNFLTDGILTDIDMKNAHPSLLVQLCKKMNWCCEHLEMYVNNRDEILSEVMNEYGVTRDAAKDLFLFPLFGGNYKTWTDEYKIDRPPTKFISSFMTELSVIQQLHYETDAKGIVISQLKNSANKKGSALSYTLQIEEDRILNCIIEFLQQKKISPAVLMFDGLMIKSSDHVDLKAIEKYVFDRTKWNVELMVKPQTEKIEIVETMDELYDVKLINAAPNYIFQKLYFEKFVSMVRCPPSFIFEEAGRFQLIKTKVELYHIFGNVSFQEGVGKNDKIKTIKFLDRWLVDEDAKFYSGFEFKPYPLLTSKNYYNFYTGLQVEKLKSDESTSTDVIYNHIRNLTGGDDDCYEYFLNYLAYLFQYTGSRCNVGLVFKSTQGTGKSSFFDWLGKNILGREYYLTTADADHVVGRFTDMKNKILVVLEEANGKDTFAASNKLKNILTAPTIRVEQKGVDAYDIDNYSHLIFLTNNETPVKIEEGDRRFVVFSPNVITDNKTEYFDNLWRAYEDDSVTHRFYCDMMSRDIHGFHPQNNRPITEEYKEIQSATIPSYDLFMDDVVSDQFKLTDEDGIPLTSYVCYAFTLYKNYRDWATSRGYKDLMTNTLFGRVIKKNKFVSAKKTNKGMIYEIRKQTSLIEYL